MAQDPQSDTRYYAKLLWSTAIAFILLIGLMNWLQPGKLDVELVTRIIYALGIFMGPIILLAKMNTDHSKMTKRIDARAEEVKKQVLDPKPLECRGCGQPLVSDNYRIADGCPCNTPRGINHGLVPKDVCTCPQCDPAGTGSSRWGKSSSTT